MTCRNAANDYSFTEFSYIEMADFEEGQIKRYAQNWFGLDKDKKFDLFWKDFQKTENKGVRELAKSPLLLSMICLAFNANTRIPQRRVDLYEEALEALLKKWDSSRGIQRDYQALPIGRKGQMFAQIAAHHFRKGEIFFKKKELATEIESFLKKLPPAEVSGVPAGDTILQSIEAQHSILVTRAVGVYSFSHLTFQEYYTARYYAADPLHFPDLIKHVLDPSWREVFLLTASLLIEADLFFELLQDKIKQIVHLTTTLPIMRKNAEKKATALMNADRQTRHSLYGYLNLSLNIDRNSARAFTRTMPYHFDLHGDFERSLDQTLDRALALDRARALDRGFTLALERGFALAPDRVRAVTRSLDLDLELDSKLINEFEQTEKTKNKDKISVSRAVFLDRALLNILLYLKIMAAHPKEAQEFYERLKTYTQMILDFCEVEDTKTYSSISNLKLPENTVVKMDWQKSTESWRTAIIEQRDIGHDWELDSKEIQVIFDYLTANKLVLDCLELASVNDREKILGRVLNEGNE